jgi:hypothetical protein
LDQVHRLVCAIDQQIVEPSEDSASSFGRKLRPGSLCLPGYRDGGGDVLVESLWDGADLLEGEGGDDRDLFPIRLDIDPCLKGSE